MYNWKSIAFAAALSVGWIIADPAVATGPGPAPLAEVQMEIARVDSLLLYLHAHPDDVSALQDLAAAYTANESYDAAIGPLARALEIAPHRRALWAALDRTLSHAGRPTITDAELTTRAARFRQSLTR